MEREFFIIDSANAWHSLYQDIRNESNNFSYLIKDAKKLENKPLNRYRDVNPFDHSRVRLSRGDKDYINASLVDVPAAGRSYILTQGPLPTTIGHFWLMVWEQNSKAVLMLNRIIEKNTVKCHQYWPVGVENGGCDTLLLTDVKLEVTALNETNNEYYTVRKFLLTDLESRNSREILQFHYTTWPDFGVPESPAAFLNFLFAVRKSGVLNNNFGPPVVHCSAGIGRSGTFCLVDSCLVLIEKHNDINSINIRQQLLDMRQYRMGLIQTPDQLRFSFLAVIEGAKVIMPYCTDNHTESLKQEIFEKTHTPDCLSEKNILSNINRTVTASPVEGFQNNFNLLSSEHTEATINYITQNKELSGLESCDLCFSNKVNLNADINSERNSPSPDDYVLKEMSSVKEDSCCTSPSLKADSFSELRKRARKEREERTAAIVENIKKKRKESETWKKRQSFFKISFGLVLMIGIGFLACKNYCKI